MSIYSTVSCAARRGTEKFELDDESGKMTASVVLECDVDDVDDLVEDLFLNNREAPFVPWTAKPIALRAGVIFDGLDDVTPTTGQCNNYKDCLVSVSYGYPDIDDTNTSGIKVQESLKPQTQVIELDYRAFRWASQTGIPILPAEAPGKIDTKIGLERKLFNLPLPLSFDTLSLIGSVNDAVYNSYSLGFAFGAETLLYLDPSFGRTVDYSGDPAANYTQNWMINPNGWNKFWRGETNTWEEIYHIGSTTAIKIYPVQDLTGILF